MMINLKIGLILQQNDSRTYKLQKKIKIHWVESKFKWHVEV